MRNEALETRWKTLQPDRTKPVFQLVDGGHPVAFYLGRGTRGEYSFLVNSREAMPKPPVLRIIRVEERSAGGGRFSVLLTLEDDELLHFFSMVCADLVDASRELPNPTSPVAWVFDKLVAWQKLLERGRGKVLSSTEVRGLMGELTYGERLLLAGLSNDQLASSWIGPSGSGHDYHLDDRDWEVKTVKGKGSHITISSEFQLAIEGLPLGLAVVSLDEALSKESGAARSLNETVTDFRSKFEPGSRALELMDALLMKVGWEEKTEYDTPYFTPQWIDEYDVLEDFPRISADHLSMALSNVRYDLYLTAIEPFKKNHLPL